jgi:hypothetical protein
MYVLCLIILSLSISPQNKTHNQLTENANKQHPSTHAQYKEASSSNPRLCVGCAVTEQPIKTQKEKEDEAFDRCFQHFYWGATILGVGGGLVLLGIVWKQTKSLINAERAWLMVDMRHSTLEHNGYQVGDDAARVTFTCRNDGNTPCWLEKMTTATAIVGKDDRLPDIAKAIKATEFTGPMPIGPKRCAPSTISLVIPIDGSTDIGQFAVVYGRAIYRHSFRKKPAITTFAYFSAPGGAWARRYDLKYNTNT